MLVARAFAFAVFAGKLLGLPTHDLGPLVVLMHGIAKGKWKGSQKI